MWDFITRFGGAPPLCTARCFQLPWIGMESLKGRPGGEWINKCSVHWLSRVLLFATPWTAARQASLSITNSWSLLTFMSIESVMPFNHLILCRPLLLLPPIPPSIRVFSNESVLPSGGQSIGISASASNPDSCQILAQRGS